jgi:RND family efflux transporter MFP subunit
MKAVHALCGGVLLSIGLLAGCEESTQLEVAEQSIRPARIFQVTAEGAATTHEFVGRVDAAQTVDVSFEVSGPLAQLPVREGQTVPVGSLIAALDATDFLLAVREAEVQVQLAGQDFKRKRKLLSERGISQSVVDDARALYDLRQVRLAQAKEALADTKIYAPFEAYIARRFTDNYVNVTPDDKIARLTDLHELLVRANIPESIYATATAESVLSMEARFSFAPGQSFALQVRENTGEADTVAQTYSVTFVMPRPKEWNILPGMTATVVVELAAAGEALTGVQVPTTALVGGSRDGFFVWVFDSGSGAIEKRGVQVGPASGTGVPIRSGLRDGELIVAAGASHLRDGMRVRMLGELITDI